MASIEDITLLYEISKALNEHLDLKKSLYKVLDICPAPSRWCVARSPFSIRCATRSTSRWPTAWHDAIDRAKYKLGEGITGRVIETGKASAIPKISEEPLFLDRTATRQGKQDRELSFICVPIKKGNQVIGALSVDKPYENDYSLEDGQKLLAVIATMIARHVINLETIRLEKERCGKKTGRLQDELKNKYRITNIIGNSNKMREVFQMISQVSQEQRHGADPRRKRHRQGTGGQLHPLQQPAGQQPFCQGQLRGLPGQSDRKRTVRP